MMMDGMDKLWAIMVAAFGVLCGYMKYSFIKSKETQEADRKMLVEHDKDLALFKQTMDKMAERMDDIVDLGKRFEESNKLILRTLAANARTRRIMDIKNNDK